MPIYDDSFEKAQQKLAASLGRKAAPAAQDNLAPDNLVDRLKQALEESHNDSGYIKATLPGGQKFFQRNIGAVGDAPKPTTAPSMDANVARLQGLVSRAVKGDTLAMGELNKDKAFQNQLVQQATGGNAAAGTVMQVIPATARLSQLLAVQTARDSAASDRQTNKDSAAMERLNKMLSSREKVAAEANKTKADIADKAIKQKQTEAEAATARWDADRKSRESIAEVARNATAGNAAAQRELNATLGAAKILDSKRAKLVDERNKMMAEFVKASKRDTSNGTEADNKTYKMNEAGRQAAWERIKDIDDNINALDKEMETHKAALARFVPTASAPAETPASQPAPAAQPARTPLDELNDEEDAAYEQARKLQDDFKRLENQRGPVSAEQKTRMANEIEVLSKKVKAIRERRKELEGTSQPAPAPAAAPAPSPAIQPAPTPAPTAIPSNTAVAKAPEGTITRNPATGERFIKRNGQWQKL